MRNLCYTLLNYKQILQYCGKLAFIGRYYFACGANLIELIDQQLQTWLKELVGDIDLGFALPPQDRGINLYLMALDAAPPMRGTVRSPLRVALHYLVTCWDKNPRNAHALLSEILFAALDHPEFEVLYPPIDWQSLGIPPQPAFVLRVIATRERPQPIVPRVQEPRVETVPSSPLSGRVLGPRDIPIVGAYVQIPSYQLSQRSDSRGAFSFPNIIGDNIELLVRAKGIERLITVSRDDDPIIIRIDSL